MTWWEHKNDVTALAYWLKEEGEWDNVGETVLEDGTSIEDDPIERLIYFFQKPWKYQKEWEKYQEKIKDFVK